MKAIYMSLGGIFAMVGSLSFQSNDGMKSIGMTAQSALFDYAAHDTVPNKSVYRDLNTGETIDVWYDRVGMRTLNKKTGEPVEFYINTSTNDTVFGRGRFIVNSYVIKGDDGKWKLDDGKVKVDGDELKVKVGDQKFKIDGDEIKIKGNGVKAKSEGDDLKVKTRDGKAKYDDDKTKVKTKDSIKNEQ